jgi:RNA polymerase sigma-70 factor, ECF subfamily
MNEKILIENAKNKDEISFTKLYNMYKDKIRNNISYIMKDTSLTDEVLNRTFLKAWLKLNTYINDISFEAWLKAIAVNTCIDYIRSLKNSNRNVDIDDNIGDIEVSCNNTDADIINLELRELLEKGMCQLSPIKRKILTLYYYSNLPYREISKLMRIPIGTVKSDISRSKAKLRKILKNYKN